MPASIFERSPTSTSDARLGTAYFFAAASTACSVALSVVVVFALQLRHRQALAPQFENLTADAAVAFELLGVAANPAQARAW